jgi:hypothetical protein
MASLVRSYNFVVLGDSWLAMEINMGYQVADRFHLIKNLVEAFENLARRHSSTL